ncbi:MAG TPA: hypothetical protein DEA08_18145, partial [Planctomycetes bacterium]|nr:hypothetical protein [Planctomycetota bacterium]
LARVAGGAEDFADVERALDLVEVPARPAAITAPAEERRPAGQLISFSFRATLIRAAAAILVAGMIGLAGYHSLPNQPDAPTADLASLEREVEEAEKVARNVQPKTSMEPSALASAQAHYQAVFARAQTNPQAQGVAREAGHQLAAFRLLKPPALSRPRPRPKATPNKATAYPAGAQDPSSSFLISNEPVLREYPDSLAALYVLKRFRKMLTEIREHGRIRFDQTTASPKMTDFQRQIAGGFRKQDRLKLVERDLQALTTLRFDWSEVRLHVDPRITRAAHQADLLQRGLHAEELGDLVVARDCYREVIALGDSKAAAIARQHLARLG